MTSHKNRDFKMPGHGGFRVGAGRPKGRLNSATIERDMLRREAALRLESQYQDLSALDIIQEIAKNSLLAGDYRLALAAAKEILPYVTPRISPIPAVDPNKGTVEEIGLDCDPLIMDEDLGET